MSQKHKSPHILPGEWKLPLNLAIGLHLLVLLSAIFLPKFLQQRPILPEITTIDLMSTAEPAGKKEPAAHPAAIKAAKQPVKKEVKEEVKEEVVPPKPAEIIKSEVAKKIPPPVEKPIPVPEPTVAPEPVAKPAPAEAISIKPSKQKQKKEIKEIPDTRAEDAKIRKEELKNITQKLQEDAKKESTAQETIKRQRQQAAAREESRRAEQEAKRAEQEAKRAELEARMAAADAKDALRDQIRTPSGGGSSAGASPAASSQSMGILNQQYYATIMAHIQQHWQPPDVKTWAPNLLAIVSITIASDGQIVSQDFEQESGDRLFDQFVLKTLDASNPLPPPPAALQKQRLEVGLRFKPSGIQ
ncbi:MAG: cell envelope integrity protein TolA [Deltaproteobacteria bacterium]|nr:cell envelope integrity protein TolA [Deltaproteobacteria bacterium]